MEDKLLTKLYIILFVSIVTGLVLSFLFICKTLRKYHRLKKYADVTVGMKKEEMLTIMGNGYSKSLLRNNREKYEWRILFGSGSYRVIKVDIYVKDGYVEEVRPFNL